MLIQKLRIKQGWSQQQLADASGLSVRTIQRIEAGNPASIESLKCLAAVFEVDYQTLATEENMTTAINTADDRQEAEAFEFVRKLRRLYLHLVRYVIIVSVLLAINLWVSPQRMWIYWVIGGWGLGLLLHAFSVFRSHCFLGPQWEREQVEKRLGRRL